jgi:hypothetical protein
MTRLSNPDAPNDETRPGPNAAVVDKILSLSDRKRARPLPAGGTGSSGSGSAGAMGGSSLEYTPDKSKSRGQQVGPNQMRSKNADQQKQQQQQQQEQQMQQQNARPTVTTRARGSSGIPPRTLEMSDLEGMDAEEILQALYDNPDLVAAASERFDQENEKKKTGKRSMNKKTKKPKKPSSEYYRTDDGRVIKEGADRLDLLKQEGFPYMQWIIICLIVGLGAYQIYKLVARPNTTKATKAVRGAKKVKNNIKGKKPASRSSSLGADVDKTAAKIEGAKKAAPSKQMSAPQKPNVPKKKAAEKKVEIVKVVEEKKAEAVKVVVKEKAPVVEKAAPQQMTKKGRKTKAKAAAVPDSVSTDGSSSTTAEVTAQQPAHAAAASKSVALEALPTDEGEWQTVGTKSAPVVSEPEVKEPAQAPASKNGSSKKQPESVPTLKEEAAPMPAPVEAVTESKEIGKATDAASFKPTKSKKSKKKKAAMNSPKENGASNGRDIQTMTSTDSDAALALQLQTEEEHMAQSEDKAAGADAGDDVWEEVATKKKKPVALTAE